MYTGENKDFDVNVMANSVINDGIQWVNTSYFKKFGEDFMKNGHFTKAPPGSKDYRDFWLDFRGLSLEGYTVGNATITGYNFWFLNATPMNIVKDPYSNSSLKIFGFPRFWDMHYGFFNDLQASEEAGKHFAILKPRGTGFSEIFSSMATRDYTLVARSKSFFFAANEGFLNKDGVLTKCWDKLEFLNTETNGGLSRLRQKKDADLHKRASYIDEFGNEKGPKSEIIGRVVDHPRKVRGARTGTRGKVYFEEGGSFPNLSGAIQATRPLVEQGGVTTGQIIVWGTGGEDGPGLTGLEHIFYHPRAYNMHEFDNVWDRDRVGTKSGWFFPVYKAMDGFTDEQGNCDEERAKAYHDNERKEIRSVSPKEEDKYIAEYPYCLCPETWVSHKKLGLIKIKNVKEKHDNGEEDLFKLITKKGREIIATKNHGFYNGKKYIDLENLKIGDKLIVEPVNIKGLIQRVKIESDIKSVFSVIEINDEFARFIGLYMGDGSVSRNNGSYTLSIVFDRQDIESYEWYKRFCVKYLKQPTSRIVRNKCVEVRVNSKSIKMIADGLELIKKRENDKDGIKRKVHVPEYIMTSPKTTIKEFLKGIFDSDGCAYKNNRTISMYSKHDEFIRDVQILLTGFGYNPTIKIEVKTNGNGYDYKGQSMWLNAYDSRRFAREIGFISERKNAVTKSWTKKVFHSKIPPLEDFVNTIEFHSRGQVYDITAPDSYYSANGIRTHNSPAEALTRMRSNLFPVAELQRQLTRVRSDEGIQGFLKHGWIMHEETGLKFVIDPKARPLKNYPNEEKSTIGCITVVESPYKDSSGKTPVGLYTIVLDMYYKDEASDSESLASCYVYKHRNNLSESEDDILVAWYTARPGTTQDYIRNLFLMAKFYNATIQSEIAGGGKGVIDYARVHKLLHFCELEPDIVLNNQQGTKRNKQYFMNVPTDIVKLALIYLADWLKQERSLKEGDDGEIVTILNLHKIYDEGLLEELIKFNDEGNFDRVSAMRLLPFMIKERVDHAVQEAQENSDNFWNRRLFTDRPAYMDNQMPASELKDF